MKRFIKSALTFGFAICFFLSFFLTTVNGEDTLAQVISQVDELLVENPLPEGKKGQAIKIAEDDTVTILLVRQIEGAGLKPHFHKTHDESLYVVRGAGQLLINDKWVDLKPGSIHFNPKGKVHCSKQMGSEPLITIAIFTPGMKEPDRQFVE